MNLQRFCAACVSQARHVSQAHLHSCCIKVGNPILSTCRAQYTLLHWLQSDDECAVTRYNGFDTEFVKPASVQIDASTWKQLGTRVKLIYLRKQHPELLDVAFGNPQALTALGKEYGVDFSDYELDTPSFMPMSTQYQNFRYAISIGRKNCWADRLRYLLMSPMAVLLQLGRPCVEYWEDLLVPYQHYIPVDASLDNLTAAIAWGNDHVAEVQQIVHNANALMAEVLSLSGLYYYTENVLATLAQKQRAAATSSGKTVTVLKGAKRFTCTADQSICQFGGKTKSSFWHAADEL
eukprot:m.1115022 g.1115022  ORF g.1115022 m.1115022 type:complete len:293 (-) comp24369_c0_seq2:2567-3445(-)